MPGNHSRADELVPLRGRRIAVHGAGGPLAVYRSGAGAPVVLVHGITGSALQWHPVVPALARRYEVIDRPRAFLGAVLPFLAAHAAR